jgi:hypothetical protein
MKTPTIVTAVLISTLLAIQPATASTGTAASQQATISEQSQDAPAMRQPMAAVEEQKVAAESYADLVKRIKQDSLRELSEKLDTREFISELVSSTVKGFAEVALGGKPQL